MQNFNVPVADVNKGFDTAMSGFRSYVDATAAKNKIADDKSKYAVKANELNEVFSKGTPSDVASYLIDNPDMAKQFSLAQAAKKTLTDEEDDQWAWGILSGQLDPVKATIQRSELIHQRGGDAKHSIQMATEAMQGKDTPQKIAIAILAKNQPDRLKQFMESTGQGKTKPPTDLASFVDLEKKKWLIENPGKTDADIPPQILQDAALNFKRQQAGEAAAVSIAKTGAELDTRIEKEPILKTATTTAQKKVEAAYDPIIAGAVAKAKNASDLAYAQAIKQAETEGAAITAETTDKLKMVSNTRSGITILDEAISQIDNGASTGVVANLFPNIRKATIELDNTRKRLGLNLIQSTTFGALSEGERGYALDTAMPTGLSPTELRSWLVRKRDAQEKLINGFEKYTIELGKPGMTRSKVLQMGISSSPTKTITSPSGAKTITSQQEYQSLPAGTEYIYNGQKFKKGQ